MSAAIPNEVPSSITAGDLATWRISLSDYSAGDGWVLSYAFFRRGGDGTRILITSTADSSQHLVSVPIATTTYWMPGDYDGQAYVTKTATSERYQVWYGLLTVCPNYAAEDAVVDPRSIARKTLEALEAAILKAATSQSTGTGISGSIVEWEVEGLKIKRGSTQEQVVAELTKQRDRYAAIVKTEEMKAARAAGRGTGRRILTRFVSA